jgi:two-component system, OmpR family, sensor kinase
MSEPNATNVTERPAANTRESGRNIATWLRPFSSLRFQLMFGYGFLLILLITLVAIFSYQTPPLHFLILAALILTLLGLFLMFGFTTFLLRPLWQVTDAAQAIASGDFKQRKRLPLRLPPQDEIDRLAGSLDEMVTRLERADELQNAAEQRFQRFFGDASHQLRTPLTSLRGFTEILLRGAKDDPETAQHILTRMKSEAERMTYLINNFLTLARLDDRTPLKTHYVDLIALSTERIEQIKTLTSDGPMISLQVKTNESLGVQADEERLKQLLFILLDNAVKYARPAPDGKITLQLDRQHDYAIIEVIDNGEGIAEEDLVHIFDSFYRGRYRKSSNGTTGAGLGLAIAQAIVRAHHGNISVKSELNKGTVFKVELPSAC